MFLQLLFVSLENLIFKSDSFLLSIVLVKVEISLCLILQVIQSFLNVITEFDNHAFHIFALRPNVVVH